MEFLRFEHLFNTPALSPPQFFLITGILSLLFESEV